MKTVIFNSGNTRPNVYLLNQKSRGRKVLAEGGIPVTGVVDFYPGRLASLSKMILTKPVKRCKLFLH